MKYNTSIITITALLIVVNGCRNDEKPNTNPNNLNKMNLQECNHIAGKKIFFGHQSVGYNIIEGIEELKNEICPGVINIIESRSVDTFNTPVFAHALIGENLNPKAKIDDFIGLMQSGLADSLDIAVLKFCYVDITRNTDIQELFSYYKTTFEKVQKAFPHTMFIHMTVPLNTKGTGLKGTGIKGLIKWLIGYDNNTKRNRYNKLLRKTYNSDCLFDIAMIESTYPDGKRETGASNSYALVPDYTTDGGHLNEAGRRRVAEQFLLFLAHIDN